MKKVFYFSTILLFVSSCAIPPATRLVPTELATNHSVTLKDGYSIVTSVSDSTEVAVLGEQFYSSITLTVFCFNKKGEAKNIIPTQIKVTVLDEKGMYANCKTISADQYIKSLQKQERWASALSAVSSGLEQVNAQNAKTTTTSYVNVSNSDSYQPTKLAVTTTTTGNKAAEQLAIANGQIQQHNIRTEYAQLYNQANNELLKENTIKLGEAIAGKVMIECPTKTYKFFIVTIPFGNETHKFILKPDVAK